MTRGTTAVPGVLEARIAVDRGGFRLEAALTAAPGELVAVLGPNGAGKSTLLEAIAGRIDPDAGRISLGDRALFARGAQGASGAPSEPPTAAVPPEQRRIGWLSQQPMLFPHLSVLENVAFGPRAQGVARAAAHAEARTRLEAVGLADLAERRPHELSGGQQQRAAIARALAARPAALLLDEPFAALDVETATRARRLIGAMRAELGIPMLLVTHDPLDAVVLADRAAILHDGRIVQQGPVAEVLGHPETAFAAALAGMNLVRGAALDATTVRTDDAHPLVLAASAGALRTGRPATAVFSPARVRVARAGDAPNGDRSGGAVRDPDRDGNDAANHWRGTVATLEPAPGGVRLHTAQQPTIAVDLPAPAAVDLGVGPGVELTFAVGREDVSVREAG